MHGKLLLGVARCACYIGLAVWHDEPAVCFLCCYLVGCLYLSEGVATEFDERGE